MKLKKIMKWSVITMAMMAGICFAPQSGKAAEKLEVKIPTERAIYQRDNNNYANVKVSIEYSGTGEVSAKLYRNLRISPVIIGTAYVENFTS